MNVMANRKQRNNNRQRRRKNGGSPNNVYPIMGTASRRIGGPKDPPSRGSDLLVPFTVRLAIAGGVGTFQSVTPGTIASGLPTGFAGSTNAICVKKISMWGADSNVVTSGMKLQFPAPGLASGPGLPFGMFTDGASYSDLRVSGQSRAAIHLVPPPLMKESWFSPTDSSTVLVQYIPDGAAAGDLNYIDVACILRSSNATM